MKLRTKSIITLVALLLLGITEAWAQRAVTVIIQQNGTQVTVSSDGNGGMTSSAGTIKVLEPAQDGTVTLTATPATGFYITAEQISVLKTIDGGKAQTRETGVETPVNPTALTPNDDPSGVTSYSFKMELAETAEYDYEITANFLSRIDIKDATVQVAGTYEATGEPITVEADKVKVTVGGKELAANEFEISDYENNTDPGDATIIIAGLRQYTGTATGTFTINRGQGQGYGLWINDIQVTEDNYFDVLGNSTDSKSGTIVFNPEKNTLVMTNDVSNVEIESRLESLTLHINDVNKVKSIRFNNLDDATKTGKLAITTNGNFPGQIIITNDAGVSAISGFSEITLNMGLQYLEPELVEIENGELYKYDWDNTNSDNPVKDPTTKAVCDAVTIGVVITPLTKNVTVSMTNASNYTAKDENGNTILDENGNPKTVSMMNFAQNKDILLTLWTKNDEDNYQKGNDGDWPDAGFDNSDGDPGITMVITMTDAQALAVAASVLANTIQPGGTTYSMEFKGATFIVPAGSGEIDVWVKTDPGYVYKLLPVGLSGETHKLDFNSPSIKEYEDLGNGKIKVTVEYNDLPTQTYYMLYLAEEAPSGARGGTRLGKRDKAHGKLYSVGVRPRSITDVNPASKASGNVINEAEDPKGVIDNPTPPTPPTGIQTVASESSVNSNKWFTADGRQLEGKPTKPGFYIRNGKKVVIK